MSEALHVTFINPDQAKAALARMIGPHCRAHWDNGGGPLAVTVQPIEDARTAQQNKFYWGVILAEISEQARIDGQRYTVDAWHELMKRQCLPRVQKRVRIAGKKRPVVTTAIGTTTGLSVKKMSEYMERVMAFAATELGVQFSASRWDEAVLNPPQREGAC